MYGYIDRDREMVEDTEVDIEIQINIQRDIQIDKNIQIDNYKLRPNSSIIHFSCQ